ncbi:MAG: helix-turn-helix transcriptional regulator [Clostridia bacterium]|nr:helix-turn-helix transcriptional regulator [Clostridia bacterium]
MKSQFDRTRYTDNPGYRLVHIKGTHAGDSALPYLHYSPNFLLFYFKHGTGNIKIEGRHYNINDGDIILINPSELFQLTVDDKTYHERISLSMTEGLLASYPYAAERLFAPFYNREKGTRNRINAETVSALGFNTYMEDILKFLGSTDAEAPLLAFCKIIELLSKLNETMTKTTPSASAQNLLNPLISDVLNYLNLHFKEDLSIDAVAEQFNIDKSYLSHLFKNHVGMSLWTYVIFRRLQLFNSLIREGGAIEATCYKVGFRNYSNFFRLYKKHMKMTPTEFKAQIKSGKKIIIPNMLF